MAQRFYQVKLDSRPVFWEDIGERLTITGIIIEGESRPIILITPNSSSNTLSLDNCEVIFMNTDEWSKFIQCSDDPKVLEIDETGGVKAVHRKLRYEISGAVQQKVWVRDGLKCMYCKGNMGSVQLTIDHFMPLEMGGPNIPSNYLSACRKCNKRKGGLHPKDFCLNVGVDYEYLVDYLKKCGDRL